MVTLSAEMPLNLQYYGMCEIYYGRILTGKLLYNMAQEILNTTLSNETIPTFVSFVTPKGSTLDAESSI